MSSPHRVLILVLVEDGLGAYGNGGIIHNPPTVLILVLVEDGLGVYLLILKRL